MYPECVQVRKGRYEAHRKSDVLCNDVEEQHGASLRSAGALAPFRESGAIPELSRHTEPEARRYTGTVPVCNIRRRQARKVWQTGRSERHDG